MTVVNPKSISGINSITMASGSDNLLTIHTTNTTERVRVNSDGDVIVGSGITVSPDGDIFATGVTTSTTFVGGLTGDVTGTASGNTTISNNADNRVVTGGSGNALNGEANLTFNGGETGDAQLTVHAAEADANSDSELILETSNDFATSVVMFKDTAAEAGSIAYNHGDNYIKLSTNGTDGGTERVRIDSSGRLLLGAGAIATPKSSGSGGLDLDSGLISLVVGGNENSTGRTDGTSKINRIAAPHRTNSEEPVAMISCQASTSTNTLFFGGGSSYTNAVTEHKFYTATDSTTTTGTERLRIQSDGDIGLLTQTPNLSGYTSPTTSIGKSGNPYSVLELQGTQTSDGAMGLITGYNTSGSARIATINWNRQAANNSGAISFETASAGSLGERCRVTNDGLTFGGDIATANALDDYEEGTWTPSFTQGVSGGGYSSQNGHYTKVGRLVMISARIDGNGLSANNDYLLLGGLPFTTVASGGTAGGLYFAYSDNMYSGSSGTNLALTIIVNNNATVCEFFDGDGTQKRGDDFYDVNRNIHIVGTYHAA